MRKTVLIFAALITCLLVLFQISRYSIFNGFSQTEIVLAVLALLFFVLGVFIQRKTSRTPVKAGADLQKVKQLELTEREYEVLLEICRGYSNKEIGEHLFISESTIKTHVSKVLLKLDVRRRTQIIGKAKALGILPEEFK